MAEQQRTLFVTAIDTGCGKTVATGLLARSLQAAGYRTGTMKPVQTGCSGIAEDILTHRQICGEELTAEDRSGLTGPEVLQLPAAPALAARTAGRTLTVEAIDSALRELQQRYELLLVEGAGGLFVPLTEPADKENRLLIDWLARHNLPTVLVTSGKLGGINHTLLSLEALHSRGIPLRGLLYNLVPETDQMMHRFALEQFSEALLRLHYPAVIIKIPRLDNGELLLDGVEQLLEPH